MEGGKKHHPHPGKRRDPLRATPPPLPPLYLHLPTSSSLRLEESSLFSLH